MTVTPVSTYTDTNHETDQVVLPPVSHDIVVSGALPDTLPPLDEAATQAIRELLTQPRTIKAKDNSYTFSITLMELLKSLQTEGKEHGINLDDIRVIGSGVPSALGKKYFQKVTGKEEVSIREPQDLDIRILCPSLTNESMEVLQKLFLVFLSKQGGRSNSEIKSQGLKNYFTVGNEASDTYFFITSIGEEERVDLIIAKTLRFDHLFCRDDLSLPLAPFLEGGSPLVSPLSNDGLQACSDLVEKVLRLPDEEEFEPRCWEMGTRLQLGGHVYATFDQAKKAYQASKKAMIAESDSPEVKMGVLFNNWMASDGSSEVYSVDGITAPFLLLIQKIWIEKLPFDEVVKAIQLAAQITLASQGVAVKNETILITIQEGVTLHVPFAVSSQMPKEDLCRSLVYLMTETAGSSETNLENLSGEALLVAMMHSGDTLANVLREAPKVLKKCKDPTLIGRFRTFLGKSEVASEAEKILQICQDGETNLVHELAKMSFCDLAEEIWDGNDPFGLTRAFFPNHVGHALKVFLAGQKQLVTSEECEIFSELVTLRHASALKESAMRLVTRMPKKSKRRNQAKLPKEKLTLVMDGLIKDEDYEGAKILFEAVHQKSPLTAPDAKVVWLALFQYHLKEKQPEAAAAVWAVGHQTWRKQHADNLVALAQSYFSIGNFESGSLYLHRIKPLTINGFHNNFQGVLITYLTNLIKNGEGEKAVKEIETLFPNTLSEQEAFKFKMLALKAGPKNPGKLLKSICQGKFMDSGEVREVATPLLRKDQGSLLLDPVIAALYSDDKATYGTLLLERAAAADRPKDFLIARAGLSIPIDAPFARLLTKSLSTLWQVNQSLPKPIPRLLSREAQTILSLLSKEERCQFLRDCHVYGITVTLEESCRLDCLTAAKEYTQYLQPVLSLMLSMQVTRSTNEVQVYFSLSHKSHGGEEISTRIAQLGDVPAILEEVQYYKEKRAFDHAASLLDHVGAGHEKEWKRLVRAAAPSSASSAHKILMERDPIKGLAPLAHQVVSSLMKDPTQIGDVLDLMLHYFIIDASAWAQVLSLVNEAGVSAQIGRKAWVSYVSIRGTSNNALVYELMGRFPTKKVFDQLDNLPENPVSRQHLLVACVKEMETPLKDKSIGDKVHALSITTGPDDPKIVTMREKKWLSSGIPSLYAEACQRLENPSTELSLLAVEKGASFGRKTQMEVQEVLLGLLPTLNSSHLIHWLGQYHVPELRRQGLILAFACLDSNQPRNEVTRAITTCVTNDLRDRDTNHGEIMAILSHKNLDFLYSENNQKRVWRQFFLSYLKSGMKAETVDEQFRPLKAFMDNYSKVTGSLNEEGPTVKLALENLAMFLGKIDTLLLFNSIIGNLFKTLGDDCGTIPLQVLEGSAQSEGNTPLNCIVLVCLSDPPSRYEEKFFVYMSHLLKACLALETTVPRTLYAIELFVEMNLTTLHQSFHLHPQEYMDLVDLYFIDIDPADEKFKQRKKVTLEICKELAKLGIKQLQRCPAFLCPDRVATLNLYAEYKFVWEEMQMSEGVKKKRGANKKREVKKKQDQKPLEIIESFIATIAKKPHPAQWGRALFMLGSIQQQLFDEGGEFDMMLKCYDSVMLACAQSPYYVFQDPDNPNPGGRLCDLMISTPQMSSTNRTVAANGTEEGQKSAATLAKKAFMALLKSEESNQDFGLFVKLLTTFAHFHAFDLHPDIYFDLAKLLVPLADGDKKGECLKNIALKEFPTNADLKRAELLKLL